MLELSDLCICLERLVAVERGEFYCLPEKGGWVFTDWPLRERTGAAAYFAIARGLDDHTGEPYVWQSCPFCGAVLPIYSTGWQDDGEG